jgi:hypothetical protein
MEDSNAIELQMLKPGMSSFDDSAGSIEPIEQDAFDIYLSSTAVKATLR